MPAENQCCCLHVKSCAILVGILGLFSSVVAIILCFAFWISAPFALFVLFTYGFILVGVYKENHGIMLAAEIMLGIYIALSGLQCIFILIFGFFSSWSFAWISKQSHRQLDYYDVGEFTYTIFVIAFLLSFIELIWNIYSFIVVHRARNSFRENAISSHPVYPYGSGITPLYVYGSYQPQRAHATPGTPHGYVTDTPHFQPPQSIPSVYPQLETTPTAPPSESEKGGYVNDAFK